MTEKMMNDNSYERKCVMDPELLVRGIKKLPEVLAQMGYKDLREGQKGPINSIMSGRDTFAILATGGGKTVLYAVPTKCLGWKTVVLSPLIALMRDQVQSLNLKGFRCAALNSLQTEGQNSVILQDWIADKLDILYVAPERLADQQVLNILRTYSPSLIALDEAHCLSQWGANFRPAYRRCGELVKELNPKVVVALTATATDAIINDVKSVLGIQNCILHWNYEPRLNLHLSSEFVTSDSDMKTKLLNKVRQIKGSVIVYADTIAHIGELAGFLSSCGESVEFYTGQMSAADRNASQDSFMHNRSRIIVATSAFGMGIDKPDIRGIIHAYPPGSLEAVSQETGRASRDGEDAVCHMFYNNIGTQLFMVGMTNPSSTTIHNVWKFLDRKKDNNNEVAITIKDLVEQTGIPVADGPEGALNFLQAIGCVERTDSSGKLYEIIVNDEFANTPTLQKTLDVILQKGLLDRTTLAGNKVYKIDIEFIGSQLNKGLQTVKTHIAQMAKAGTIEYKAPFKGKITKLIKPPTKDDYIQADLKRGKELKKVNAVMDYCKCPDKDKQDLLTSYFKLNQA